MHHHIGRAFSSFVFSFLVCFALEGEKGRAEESVHRARRFLLFVGGFPRHGREVGRGMLDFCLFWTGQDRTAV